MHIIACETFSIAILKHEKTQKMQQNLGNRVEIYIHYGESEIKTKFYKLKISWGDQLQWYECKGAII